MWVCANSSAYAYSCFSSLWETAEIEMNETREKKNQNREDEILYVYTYVIFDELSEMNVKKKPSWRMVCNAGKT